MPHSYTFPRTARITRAGEFKRTFDEGKRVGGTYFVCFVAPRVDGEQESRLGLAVSRKVGGAVVRNRVKRRFREMFRLHRHTFDHPVDVVVVAKPAVAGLSWDALLREMLRMWRRGGVFGE